MNTELGSKALLTVPEVALRLGLGRSFTYQLVMRGEIPSLKLGRARRVPTAALGEFIEMRMQQERAEDGSRSA